MLRLILLARRTVGDRIAGRLSRRISGRLGDGDRQAVDWQVGYRAATNPVEVGQRWSLAERAVSACELMIRVRVGKVT